MDVGQFINAIPPSWFVLASREGITASQLLTAFFESRLIEQRKGDLKFQVVGTNIVYDPSIESMQLCHAAIQKRIDAARCPCPTELLSFATVEFDKRGMEVIEQHLTWCPWCTLTASSLELMQAPRTTVPVHLRLDQALERARTDSALRAYILAYLAEDTPQTEASE